MTENEILSSVKNYLVNHNCQMNRLDPKKMGNNSKCPDFEVSLEQGLMFYCEVKSPLLLVNDITQMFHWTTTVTKLRDHIHKAVEQFSDQDLEHKFPWVLVFTSDHMQLNWTNMTHAIAGKVYYGDQVVTDLTNLQRVKETENDVKNIDLFIWMQMNDKADINQLRMMIQPLTKLPEYVLRIGKVLEPLPTDKSYRR